MATYKQIQAYVHKKYGYVPETCWIAHVKELSGLPVRRAPNRRSDEREKPCPPGKQPDIREAFEYFEMLTAGSDILTALRHTEIELSLLASYSASDVEKVLLGGISPTPRLLRESAIADGWVRLGKPTKEEWRFSMTSEFQKSTTRLDKKLLGRILEAIADICKKPTESRGDTIKPLQGELKGKWRYRIGDYRLIYQPDEQTHTVFLLAMFPRGSAYVD